MNTFFQQLFDLTDGIDVSIKVKRKNGKLTLSVLPETTAVLTPAIITGTPEELDAGFFDAIKAPIETAIGLKTDLEQFAISAKVAKELEETKPDTKKSTDEKSTPKSKKPVIKKEVKAEKPKIEEPDLFTEE